MNTRSLSLSKTSLTESFTPTATGLLQRKCASCGQHTIAGGECAECGKKKQFLQRRAAHQAETSEVPPIVDEVLRSPGQSLDEGTRSFMESRFGHDFSRIRVNSIGSRMIQPRLTVSQPGDLQEQEAERIGGEISRQPETYKQQNADLSKDQTKTVKEQDFSQVRIHTDDRAAEAAQLLSAEAFTVDRHIVFGANQFAPNTIAGRSLLAHELTHVVQQQGTSSPMLQRRLIATGSQTEVNTFFSLVEPAIGLQLSRDPATNQIQAIGTRVDPATSPALRSILTRIMDDPAQNAEVNLGIAQPTVAVGAFPIPPDMTGSRVQRIDMDDILALEAGAPGNGVAKLAHEIRENYEGHAAAPIAGVNRFPAAHTQGVAAESRVAQDLVGPGNRVADVDMPIGSNTFTRIQDFENYYLVFDLTRNSATNDFTVSNARRAPKVTVSTHTVDSFITDSDAVPALGAATIAAAAASVAANPSSTVLIEGFTDSPGSVGHNLGLSLRRAQQARTALIAAGVGAGRIHIEGRGETRFVAPNNNEANRARNRRIVITVTRPGP